MDLNKLEHFLAVAEELSFTRAAARLRLAQSGVSSSVKFLERDLGAALFERTTQRVELTAAGQALVPRARRILADVRDARQAVDEVRAGLRGTLALGLPRGLTPAHLSAALADFRSRFPLVDVRLTVPGQGRGGADHAEALRDGSLDLAYVMTAGPIPGLRVHVLSAEVLILACAEGDPLADRAEIRLTDLRDSDFIDFPIGWGIRSAVDRAFVAAGLPERRTTLEMTETATVIDLVRHRLGVAFVPESSRDQAPDLRYRTISDYAPCYDLAIAADGSREPGPVTDAFRSAVLNRHGIAQP